MKDIEEEYNEASIVKAYADQVENIGLWNIEKWAFENYVDKKAKILDIGCGAGRETIPLFEMGYENIIGADLSEKMIESAKAFAEQKSLNIPFEVQDITKLKYDDGSFDCVFLPANIIMCVPSFALRDQAVKETRRVLRCGGLAIFIVWDKDALENQEFEDFAKMEDADGYDLEKGDIVSAHYDLKVSYLHEAEPDYLPNLLKENGFEIERSDFCDNIVMHGEREIYTEKSKIIIARKICR